MYKLRIKRLIDLLLSIAGIIIISPLLGVLYLISLKEIGRPVFFMQERAGKNGKPFMMYKFRTMTNERDDQGHLLPDELRTTKYGQLLRKLSVDELPQLINIIKGDMSIIGPRPLPTHYQFYYDDFQMKRQLVRPGIVGLASVRGRNNQSWDSKFANDIEYVNNCSFMLDMKIFSLAVITVFKHDNVTTEGYVSAEPFIREGMRKKR